MPSATQTEPAVAHCQSCGAEVVSDTDHCPACGRRLHERSNRITLAITLLLIFAGMALTQYFVNLHRDTELGLARRWFTRGEEAMQANLPKGAADAYRTALNYDRENEQYRLRLAQALVGVGTRAAVAEARAHLLSLWEEEPANGEVNLTLARLEAHRGRYSQAVRYYNDAINGVWQDDPRQRRIEARFELTRYFLQQQKWPRAQAELLALQADAPPDPADQLQLGQMLLQVNDPAHALQAYNAVLSKNDNNAQAWLGEGQAYLALSNYAEAERATAKAVEHDPNLPGAHDQLELVRELLRVDPMLRGLPLAERASRAAKAFEAALTRLSACAAQQHIDLTATSGVAPAGKPGPASSASAPAAPPNVLQLLYASGLQKQPDTTEKALRRDPDGIEPTMQYVFQVESTLAPTCPNMELTDRALLTLAQHENEAPK